MKETLVKGVLVVWAAGTLGMVYTRGEEPVMIPAIDGPAWSIAGDPDLGKFTAAKQEPVDFAVWQAADGTWQLWSCIRGTKCGGHSRLFYRWEGRKLTDSDWRPLGIAMMAEEKYGEAPGGLQAPFVLKSGDLYSMFYGNWHGICLAESRDGKRFTRVLGTQKSGSSELLPMPEALAAGIARDPMVLKIGDAYYCYFMANPHRKGAVYCSTSPDMKKWIAPKMVRQGGRCGDGPGSVECPFVVSRHGWFYLFATQSYGLNMLTHVHRSHDPLDFGVGGDKYWVCSLPVAAPEIVAQDGQDYIVWLKGTLKGIQAARLKWIPRGDPALRSG